MPRRSKTGFPIAIDVYIGVEEEGAKGDGATDDTAAFQAAINKLPAAGGIIQVQEGNFIVTGASLSVGAKTVFWLLNGQVNTSFTPSSWPGTIINSATSSVAATSVSIVDAGGYFTGIEVEAALQELGADVAAGASGLANIVEDVTPQLGANLDLNGFTITGLVIGTNVQAFDATLTSLAAVAGVAGDVLYASGTDTWARLAKGADAEVLTLASGIPSWAAAATGGGFGDALLHAEDQKAAGSNGGTFTSGAWQTRTLNEVTNEITGASIAANQITLPAGTYWFDGHAPASGVNNHKARLYNVTDAADLLHGTPEFSNSGLATRSLVSGRFTLAGIKVIEFQHRAQSTAATTGFGRPATLDSKPEVYAVARIWKVG